MLAGAATGLLGTMLGSAFGKSNNSSGPGIGTYAAGAAGVAAVGGLSYLAYQHFTQKPGMQQGHPGMPGGGMQPGMPGMQPGMPGAPQQGGGFMDQFVGRTDGLNRGGFSAPGYEWQTGGAQPQQQPQQSWGQQPQQSWGQQPQQSWGQQPQQPQQPPANQAPSAPVEQPAWALEHAPKTAQPTAPSSAATPTAPTSAGAPAAASPEQQKQALLLVRAMIAAAFADGTLDDKERSDILGRLDAAGVTPEERTLFLAEMAAPKPVTALASEVTTPEMAEQFYIVSVLSVTADTPAEKAHLTMLPVLLNLSPDQISAIHQKTGIPRPA